MEEDRESSSQKGRGKTEGLRKLTFMPGKHSWRTGGKTRTKKGGLTDIYIIYTRRSGTFPAIGVGNWKGEVEKKKRRAKAFCLRITCVS